MQQADAWLGVLTASDVGVFINRLKDLLLSVSKGEVKKRKGSKSGNKSDLGNF